MIHFNFALTNKDSHRWSLNLFELLAIRIQPRQRSNASRRSYLNRYHLPNIKPPINPHFKTIIQLTCCMGITAGINEGGGPVIGMYAILVAIGRPCTIGGRPG